MRYLHTIRLARITIQDRREISFIVPADVAIIVFWFLASRSVQVVAVIAWWMVYGAARRYYNLCDYLARLAADLLTVQVSTCFG